ncbi:MAG TPA: hypothetical protein VN860_05475 [Candidatus Acidoferrales bacterium]|nr:hypothetical protein [Candidatus Acidoferrales bacterium]
MRRSVYVVACALLVLASLSLVSPAAAARPNLSHINPVAPAELSTISLASGLTIGRIYDTSAHGDVISFSRASSTGVDTSNFSFALPLSGQSSMPAAKLFAVSQSNASGADRSHVSAPAAQIAGMQLQLLGGAEATVSLQNSGPTFGTGPFAANPSQGPAVFDFYNFQQSSQRIGLGQAFGLNPNDAALAASLNALPQPSNVGTSNALASPLISSLSAQGPFWYSAYAPPTQGSSMSLTIPFQLAKIPVRVRLGEQAVSTVDTSSLATQILGPAFATSAAGNYKSLTGGVTLALPLLSRRATVSLDGWYETLQHNDKMPFNLAPYAALTNSSLAAAGPGPVIYSPGTDVQQYVGAASVALPVTSHLTVNGSFAAQVSGSVDLDTLTQSLTERKTAFGGGVGYNFPKTNSSIDLFFNKNVYRADNVPTTFTENRQNLYFSVKF